MCDAGLTCFLCDRRFTGVKLLMKHLSNARSHNLNQHSHFKCAQKNCRRMYTNSRCFVRHLRKEHPQSDRKEWRNEKMRCVPSSCNLLAADIR